MNMLHLKGLDKKSVWKFLADYFFMFLLIAGIAVNFYFEMKVNKSLKHFVANEDVLASRLKTIDQLEQLRRRVNVIESYIRNYAITRDGDYLKAYDIEIISLSRDVVLVTDTTKSEARRHISEFSELRKALQRKLEYENELLKISIEDPTSNELRKAIESFESIQVNSMLSYNFLRLTTALNKEAIQLSNNQQKDRLDFISLDYAIPFLTSFIFLVIACYTLYKILQVWDLNRWLNIAVRKEQEAQQTKDQFLANMTHELRSPLNSVLGYTNLMMKTPLKGEQVKFVKSIKTSGELLLNVINEVLDYSKLQSGHIHFNNHPFHFREQLDALADIVSDRMSAKGLQYTCTVGEDVPDNLVGDSGKLLQILLNIIGNAVKFTQQGSITVQVSVVKTKKEEGKVTIAFRIRDTGIGIPSNKLAHIFDRFYQVENSLSRQHGGTGLGLSITHQMVVMQNGEIIVDSVVGEGTQFDIQIPFGIASAEDFKTTENGLTVPVTSMPNMTNSIAHHRSGKPLRVLVVDDNVMNRELSGYIFKDMGVYCKTVSSGFEALDTLVQENFDIIFRDLQMPTMDGKETTVKIREGLGINIPIVALSAYAQSAEKQKCLEAGMNAYLTKPIQEGDLVNILQQFHPAHRGAGGEGSVIDMDYLNRIAKNNPDFIETVILRVADTLPAEIDLMKTAVEENNFKKVNQLAHDMKTTFAVLGLTRLTEASTRYFETWKPGKKTPKLYKMLDEIEKAGRTISIEIRKNFSKPDQGIAGHSAA